MFVMMTPVLSVDDFKNKDYLTIIIAPLDNVLIKIELVSFKYYTGKQRLSLVNTVSSPLSSYIP